MFVLFELKRNNCTFTVEVHVHGKQIQREHELPGECSLGLYINHGHSGDLIAVSYHNFYALIKDIEDGCFDIQADHYAAQCHSELEGYGFDAEECFCQTDTWQNILDGMYIPGGEVQKTLDQVNK